MSDIDITALARRAKAQGYDDPQRLARRLELIIERNVVYLARRRRTNSRTVYDQALEEDNEVLALAMIIIESIEPPAKSNELL